MWAMGMVGLHPSSGDQLVPRSCNLHVTMASMPGLLFQCLSQEDLLRKEVSPFLAPSASPPGKSVI